MRVHAWRRLRKQIWTTVAEASRWDPKVCEITIKKGNKKKNAIWWNDKYVYHLAMVTGEFKQYNWCQN